LRAAASSTVGYTHYSWPKIWNRFKVDLWVKKYIRPWRYNQFNGQPYPPPHTYGLYSAVSYIIAPFSPRFAPNWSVLNWASSKGSHPKGELAQEKHRPTGIWIAAASVKNTWATPGRARKREESGFGEEVAVSGSGPGRPGKESVTSPV